MNKNVQNRVKGVRLGVGGHQPPWEHVDKGDAEGDSCQG